MLYSKGKRRRLSGVTEPLLKYNGLTPSQGVKHKVEAEKLPRLMPRVCHLRVLHHNIRTVRTYSTYAHARYTLVLRLATMPWTCSHVTYH